MRYAYRRNCDIGDYKKKSIKSSHNTKIIQRTEMIDRIFESLAQNMYRGIKTKFAKWQINDNTVHMIEKSSHKLWLTVCFNHLKQNAVRTNKNINRQALL